MVHQKGFATRVVPLGICGQDFHKIHLLDFSGKVHRMHRNQNIEGNGDVCKDIKFLNLIGHAEVFNMQLVKYLKKM
jgi:hypothetical protein